MKRLGEIGKCKNPCHVSLVVEYRKYHIGTAGRLKSTSGKYRKMDGFLWNINKLMRLQAEPPAGVLQYTCYCFLRVLA